MSEFERLREVLGFDPGSKSPGADVFNEVLQEVKKERAEQQKARAKEIVLEAIKIQEEQKKLKNQFEAQNKKFEKTLGKLLNRLEAMARGNEPPSEEETTTD